MEIIKQELATLEVNNTNQIKFINELMEELATIYQKMSYIDGTERQIHNEQIWMRLTKSHIYPITSFLSLQETLRLRLVSKGMNKQVIATFDIYKNKYLAMLELKRVELQTANIVIPPTQEDMNIIIQAQNGMEQLSKNDIGEMKSFPKPPSLIGQVMKAILLLLKGSKPNNDSDAWEASRKLLSQTDFIYQLKVFDMQGLTDKICQKVEHELEGITFERCQQISKASGSIFRWAQGILLYSQLPICQAKQKKLKIEAIIKQMEGATKLFEKYT